MTTTLGQILYDRKEQQTTSEDKNKKPFFPKQPVTLEQTGLSQVFVEDLICKILLFHSTLTGAEIARRICLPMKILDTILYDLKQRMILAYQSRAGINDFLYTLTQDGRKKALLAREFTNYHGPAPVPFTDYLAGIEKQSISNEQPGHLELQKALDGLILPETFLDMLGPAVNSGRGMYIFGDAGNGKTEVATRVAKCFTNYIYIPRTLIVEGEHIQLYDPQCHNKWPEDDEDSAKQDARWLKIERPAVVVGGEMDIDSLEIGYNSQSRMCEASLQLKGNNGIFVIDDFGRQRVSPEQLLNRWILPLEKKIDYLTLPSGNKIKVPFSALLVFCSNLDPKSILDEALLRRIPNKLYMGDPDEKMFIQIFKQSAAQMNIPFDQDCANYLLKKHFQGIRPMRGCHPRDILQQLVNIAKYEARSPRMTKEDIDMAARVYFLPRYTTSSNTYGDDV